MSLIDAPQFNLAAQVKQFGQFGSDANLVKRNDVLQSLADPPASGVAAQANTPATNQAEQYLAYKASPIVWSASRAWTVNQVCSKGGNLYRCTTAGTSASSGGPTGTGSSITDGTAVWTYYTKVLQYLGVFTS
jgi:hypothetical protein